MMQEPTVWSVTVTPTTVQTGRVSEVKVTVRPEEAVAETSKGDWSRSRLPSAANAIV